MLIKKMSVPQSDVMIGYFLSNCCECQFSSCSASTLLRFDAVVLLRSSRISAGRKTREVSGIQIFGSTRTADFSRSAAAIAANICSGTLCPDDIKVDFSLQTLMFCSWSQLIFSQVYSDFFSPSLTAFHLYLHFAVHHRGWVGGPL